MHHIVLLFHQAGSFGGGRHLLNGANLSRQFFSGPLIPPPKQPQKHCSPHRRARRRPCPPPPPPSRCRRNDIFGCVRVRGGVGGAVRWWIIVPDTYESLRTAHDTQRTSQTPLRNSRLFSLRLIWTSQFARRRRAVCCLARSLKERESRRGK